MTNKIRDIICSVIMIAFGILMIVEAKDIPNKLGGKDVGSAYVPTFIAICILVVAVSKLVLALVNKKPSANEKIKWTQDSLGGFGTIALMAVYMLAIEPVGFIIASVVYLFVQMMILSDNTNRKPVLFAIIAVALPVAVEALFVYAIKMPLPVGILGFGG
jgi:putative tricarboxylic transport membrane protein